MLPTHQPGKPECGGKLPKFWPRRSLATTEKDRALFARMFIAFFTLRLFALITPPIFQIIKTRCLCFAGLGAPDTTGQAAVFVVALTGMTVFSALPGLSTP